jgi:hypothetical protein
MFTVSESGQAIVPFFFMGVLSVLFEALNDPEYPTPKLKLLSLRDPEILFNKELINLPKFKACLG